jgi:hypothetical protein
MIDANFAQRFALEWVQAWNDHDLDAVIAHYGRDVIFHSPRIHIVTGEKVDAVRGRDQLRSYWEKALVNDLHFALDRVLLGSDALTILYTNHREQDVAETFVFDAHGLVQESIAVYGL